MLSEAAEIAWLQNKIHPQYLTTLVQEYRRLGDKYTIEAGIQAAQVLYRACGGKSMDLIKQVEKCHCSVVTRMIRSVMSYALHVERKDTSHLSALTKIQVIKGPQEKASQV